MQLRHIRVMLLGLVLVCASVACAPKLVGPTGSSGNFFSLWVPDSEIWLLSESSSLAEQFPRVAELTVRVQNAQGQPVDGVAVMFQVEPDWAEDASIMPQRAITRDGVAQGTFQAQTTGAVRVTVRVDDTTQETVIAVSPAPDVGNANSD